MIKNPVRSLLQRAASSSGSNSNSIAGRNPSLDTACGDLAMFRRYSRAQQSLSYNNNSGHHVVPTPLALTSTNSIDNNASPCDSAASSPRVLLKSREDLNNGQGGRSSPSSKKLIRKQSSSMFDFSVDADGGTVETTASSSADNNTGGGGGNLKRPTLQKPLSVGAQPVNGITVSAGAARSPRPLVVQRGDSSYNVVVNCRKDADTVCLQGSQVIIHTFSIAIANGSYLISIP